MRDVIFCLSEREFIIFWILAVMNCITVTIMCYVTRRECKKDGFLV